MADDRRCCHLLSQISCLFYGCRSKLWTCHAVTKNGRVPPSVTQHKHRAVISLSFCRTPHSAVSDGKQWLWLMSCCHQRPNNFDLELLSVASFHKSATDTAIPIMERREGSWHCTLRELPLSRCSQTPKVMFWLPKIRLKFLLINGVFLTVSTQSNQVALLKCFCWLQEEIRVTLCHFIRKCWCIYGWGIVL